jgi:F0F1-type ATP synthase beta subunit
MKAIKAFLAIGIAVAIALLLPFQEMRAVMVFGGALVGVCLVSVGAVMLVWRQNPCKTMR